MHDETTAAESGIDEQAGDFVTVVTSAADPPKRLTKLIESQNADGTFNVLDYDDTSKLYYFEHAPLGENFMLDLWYVLDRLGYHQHIVHGRVRESFVTPNGIEHAIDRTRPLQRTHVYHTQRARRRKDGTEYTVPEQIPTLEDTPHLWHMQDFDDVPAADGGGEFDPVVEPERAARELIRRLPPEFQGAFCIWRLSSSAGYPKPLKPGEQPTSPKIKMRLVWALSRALTAAEIKAWLDPYIKEAATKKVKAKGERAVLDSAIYSPSQPIYCAAPVLNPGIADRVPQRMGHIGTTVVPVQVPAPDAVRPDGGKVFDTKADVDAAEGPAEADIVWDAPETIAWAKGVIAEDIAQHGTPQEGEHSDIRAYKLVGKLKDGPQYGHSVKTETIAVLLKADWAPHFDLAWLGDKSNGKHANGPGCGQIGTVSRAFGAVIAAGGTAKSSKRFPDRMMILRSNSPRRRAAT